MTIEPIARFVRQGNFPFSGHAAGADHIALYKDGTVHLVYRDREPTHLYWMTAADAAAYCDAGLWMKKVH